jgi:hypothetical protein
MSRLQNQPAFELIEHSIYIGRRRLGRYAQTDKKRFDAFDAEDRPLGAFKSRRQALAAIRDAASMRQHAGAA